MPNRSSERCKDGSSGDGDLGHILGGAGSNSDTTDGVHPMGKESDVSVWFMIEQSVAKLGVLAIFMLAVLLDS